MKENRYIGPLIWLTSSPRLWSFADDLVTGVRSVIRRKSVDEVMAEAAGMPTFETQDDVKKTNDWMKVAVVPVVPAAPCVGLHQAAACRAVLWPRREILWRSAGWPRLSLTLSAQQPPSSKDEVLFLSIAETISRLS